MAVDNSNFICKDCSFDTMNGNEYYMIHHALWHQIGGGKFMLCIGCVERRLGRELNSADFPDLLVNNAIWDDKSDRLKDRLTREAPCVSSGNDSNTN